ncbi:MAG: hypothetical protein IPP90_15930 [Gemmatimonadaceae bacterium]|nr:hypothetical protein [Gemmatimonadaceae bacterium]
MESESPTVVEGITKAYGTFFNELARTARHAAHHYRSESGKLTRKPRSVEPSPADTRSSVEGSTRTDDASAAALERAAGSLFDLLRSVVVGRPL